MKLKFISAIALASLFSTFTYAELSVKSANSAVASAGFNNDRDNDNPNATQEQRENSRDALAQALNDQREAVATNQKMKAGIADKKQIAADLNNYGVKSNPAGNPVSMVTGTPSDPTGIPTGEKAPNISGTSYRLGITQMEEKQIGVSPTVSKFAVDRPDVGAIDVSVTSLKPSAPVSVTVNGITTVTTAGVLSKVDPTIQVEVPHVDALISTPRANTNDSHGASSSHGGAGHGGDNAHSNAFGGHGYGADNSHSEGFGGHSHFH